MADVLGKAVYVFEADQRPLEKGTAQAKRTVDRAGAEMQASMDRRMIGVSRRMGQVGHHMGELGEGMTKAFTIPITALAVAGVKSASDFQSSLTQVQTQANASAKEIARMRQAILAMAPAVGQTPKQLADALYHIESAGIRGAKALDVLRDSARLAAIGHSGLEETTYALTSLMKTAPKDVKGTTDAIGLLNAVVGQGDMRMKDLVAALSTGVIPVAKNAGLGLRDVGAALDVMTARGVPAQVGAERIRMTIAMLASPTQQAAKELKSVGISSTALATEMHRPNGLTRAVADLKEHMDKAGLSAVQQNKLIVRAFGGGDSSSAILTMMQNVKDLGKNFDDLGKHSGAKRVAQEWQETQKTTSFQFDQMRATAERDAIKIGNAIGPSVLRVGREVADEADKLATAFSKLPKDTQDTLMKGGLVLAGLGPAMKVLGVFTSGAGKLVDAARIAEKLASGKGTGRAGASELAGATRAVATMEVGELIVKSQIGGASGSWSPSRGSSVTSGTVARSTVRDAGAAEAGASEVSLMSLLRGGLSRLAGGGMIAGAGVGASQLAGSMVGGRAGKTISREGSWASLGAGVGTMIEPGIGTAVGAGIAAGVGEGIHLLHRRSYGTAIADSLTAGFGGRAREDLQRQLGTALDAAHEHMESHRTMTSSGQVGRPGTSAYTAPTFRITGPSRADVARAEQEYRHAGQLVASQLERGWAGYRFQNEPTMFRQLRTEIHKLPPQAQAGAVESAVAFARGLERQGRLPAGSARQMIRQIEHEFPALTRYMGLSANASVKEFTDKLDLQHARDQLNGQLKKMRGDFPQVTEAMDKTAGGVDDKARAMVKSLVGIQAHGTKPMRRLASQDLNALQSTNSHAVGVMVSALQQLAGQTGRTGQQARENLDALRDSTAKDMQSMASTTLDKVGAMSTAIKNGSVSAQRTAAREMGAFASHVQDAMANGSLTAGKGMQLIVTNLNKALKEMGQKQLSPLAIATMRANATGNYGSVPGHTKQATGGLIQIGRDGDRGVDNVPLNVAGSPIMVGRGEQVAVFNGNQQQIMNDALAARGYAGLQGMFNRERTPHPATRRFAQGGIVPRFAQGGTVSYGQLEGLWDQAGGPSNLAPLAAAIAEAESQGNPAARNPSGASGLWQILGVPFPGDPFDPTTNARMAVSKWRGAHGFTPWVTYTSGAYRQYLNGKVPADTSGGGSAWTDLTAPKVRGSGVIASIARSAIGKVLAAANKYGAAHAPVETGGVELLDGRHRHEPETGSPRLRAMIAEANAIASHNYNYEWGGGHGAVGVPSHGTGNGSGPGVGFDCSGSVSAVLHAGGLINSVPVAADFMSWGQPGPGKQVTIYASPSHVFMQLAGHYFGTSSAENPGGGANWMPTFPESMPAVRHPPGFALGGIVPHRRLNGTGWTLDPALLPPAEQERLCRNPRATLPGLATGGVVDMFARGGHHHPKHHKPTGRQHATGLTPLRQQQLNAIAREARRQVPHYRPVKLPTMTPIPGFQSGAMNRLARLDTKAGQYSTLLTNLGDLFDVTGDVQPLVTRADGSEVVNWGKPNGPAPSGMIDPDSGERTKGIYDRLREIGTPGRGNRRTLIGVNELILSTLRAEHRQAARLAKQIGPWLSRQDRLQRLDDRQVAWLKQALDLTQPMPKLDVGFSNLGHVHARQILRASGWSGLGPGPGDDLIDRMSDQALARQLPKDILEKVHQYRNAQAQIERWRDLEHELPAERRNQMAAITRRFDRQRHRMQNRSAKRRYTNQELLSDALDTLRHDRDHALSKVPAAPPKKWKGDRQTWRKEHLSERLTISGQYDAREKALRDAAAKSGLSARLRKSDALYSLGQQEKIERGTLENALDAQSERLRSLITGEESLRSSDKTWLTNLRELISKQSTQRKTTISTATVGDSSAQATLNAALDPLGDVTSAIWRTRKIDIPTLVRTAAELRGTRLPPVQADTDMNGDFDSGDLGGTDDGSSSATATDDSSAASDALNSLLLEKAQQTILRQAVQLAQDRVLLNQGTIGPVPRYGGSFGGGGVVPGRLGEPVMIEAHGSEVVFTPDQVTAMSSGGEINVSHNVTGDIQPMIKLIETKIESNGRQIARRAKRPLPGQAGVLLQR